jgi:hypothetical protein
VNIPKRKEKNGRKILQESSEDKNHNGGKKVSLNLIYQQRMRDLQIGLSRIVEILKKDGCRPMLELYPKDKNGKEYADFAIHRLLDNKHKKTVCSIKLISRSLTVERVFFLEGYRKKDFFPFDEFLNSLKEEDENKNRLKGELKILLR